MFSIRRERQANDRIAVRLLECQHQLAGLDVKQLDLAAPRRLAAAHCEQLTVGRKIQGGDSIGEYGPNTGVWRLLRMLDEEKVRATFLTCGAIAERYPDAVKAIVAKGHEIAGHGYHHETARDLTREQEDDVQTRTVAMIHERAGRRPYGWRSCTQSPNSIELLMKHGFLWNSNSTPRGIRRTSPSR